MNEDSSAAKPAAPAPDPGSASSAPTTASPTLPAPVITPEMHAAHPMPEAPKPATVFTPRPTPTNPPAAPVAPTLAPALTPEPIPQPPTEMKPEPAAPTAEPAQTSTIASVASQPLPEPDNATHADDETSPSQDDDNEERAGALEWAADETMHDRSFGQTGLFLAGVAVLTVAVYFITRHDLVSTISVAAAALFLVFYSMRRPQTVHYRLDDHGITIDSKFYAYNQFRSFAIEDELAPVGNLVLAPLQRFMPMLTVSYRHELEEDIVDILADRLPIAPHRRDAMDSLIRKLRF